MSHYNLLKTVSALSAKGTRYYINGKRVSARAFDELKDRATCLDALQTVRSGSRWRHYCSARIGVTVGERKTVLRELNAILSAHKV